jgi:hypothetical protein
MRILFLSLGSEDFPEMGGLRTALRDWPMASVSEGNSVQGRMGRCISRRENREIAGLSYEHHGKVGRVADADTSVLLGTMFDDVSKCL